MVEVNYKTSRVLLLSDLNSNVPVTIAPQNIQAIITGTGENYGEIKYIKEGISNLISQDSIVYTSGTGAIFKRGIPIGRVDVADTGSSKKFKNTASPNKPKTIDGTAAKLFMLTSINDVQAFFGAKLSK